MQEATAPPMDVTPPAQSARRKVARSHKWTPRPFAQIHSTKQEGRSVATARNVSRPTHAPQAVVYKPRYDRPLDADAVPMEWQLRAEPPKAAGATQPAMQVGPFGGLK